MSLKTIKVNPIFLMGASGGSSVKNKTRKEKPTGISLGQPNNIKKKLITRIKNFQQNNNKTGASAMTGATDAAGATNVGGATSDDTFTNDFSESVNFLNNLARDKQEHKLNKRNATLKKKQPPNPEAYMQIATELPPELMGALPPHPPFSGALPSQLCKPHPPFSGASSQAPFGASSHPIMTTPFPDIPITSTPPEVKSPWSAPPPPSYSNLKSGGTKPTYRTWLRNTQKNHHVPSMNKPAISILEDLNASLVPTAPLVPTASLVNTASLVPAASLVNTAIQVPTADVNTASFVPATAINTAIQVPTAAIQVPTSINFSPDTTFLSKGGLGARPQRKKVTRTLKYKLGKHANGKVSVLIKNNQTRRRVQTEHAQLKLKSILDIKNHLRSKNLLKVGSEAPNDVLRHIYEQSILAGQIENKAKDVLIHNYFNEEKK